MISESVRTSPLAGTWYPADRGSLAAEIDGLVDAVSLPPVEGRLLALVSPHAGYRYSGACAASGYALLGGGDFRRVIVLGPSHHVGFAGVAMTEHAWWETPLGRVAIDRETCDALAAEGIARVLPGADRREHSIEIQVPFLQHALGGFQLVPLMTGDMEERDMERLAAALRARIGGETLVVASSDLTHYGAGFEYVPFEEDVRSNLGALDGGAIELIRSRNWRGLADYRRATGITACGLAPIEALLRALPEDSRGMLLRYYTSGDLTGEWDHVVSYASLGFFDAASGPLLDEGERSALLAAAREAMTRVVSAGELDDDREPDTPGTPPPAGSALHAVRGIFVTLTMDGELRGCIGTLDPGVPLWRAAAFQAPVSAMRDPRFDPVRVEELESIRIEISVLSSPRPILSSEDFDPGRHGIILEKGTRRALFLPQVATEQGWDREATLRHLSQKAGLGPDGWRHGCALSVFTAEVFSEPPARPGRGASGA